VKNFIDKESQDAATALHGNSHTGSMEDRGNSNSLG